MNTLPHDFISLPIVICDYDAICESKKIVRVPTAEIERSRSNASNGSRDDSKEPEKLAGFTESVEDIWNRISDATKQKIREACMEVLRRTEQSRSDDQMTSFQYDDDARFLD